MKIVPYLIHLCGMIVPGIVQPHNLTQVNHFNGYMKKLTLTQLLVSFRKAHMVSLNDIYVSLVFTYCHCYLVLFR